ncbi:hypothetical protein ABXT08_04460 [Chryseobacterium sp. NRRL B-14859]|uniref:hypothetical protein n=1 Tax=Chryseobacterium sp. NRRL B-14859 TaxID=1562763 RepID=UPI00339AEDFA
MISIEILLQNTYFQNILSGIIGGLIVLGFQKFLDKKEKQKEKTENSIVGKKELKILSQDFLYQYEPEKITAEKLIEDFGHPQRRFKSEEYEHLIFEFQNAKLEVINNKEYNSVIALTVFSKLDNKYPINCRLSFEEDYQILGKAKISEIIINNHFAFDSYNTQLGFETIIGVRNDYRQTKHLKYFYLIEGNFNNIQETKNEIIKQVCVTNISDVYSFFSFYDTFYN